MSSTKYTLKKMILSAMFLALALVLPFLTGQIPQIGNKLCPMHIPVILCGFFCGPFYALIVGISAPLLRFCLFGVPVLIPTGIAMSFELATYGLVSALLYKTLPKRKPYIYVSLICAMIIGRIVWGIASVIICGIKNTEFGWTAFITGGFINAVPGMIIQIILIPILVMTLKKYTANNL